MHLLEEPPPQQAAGARNCTFVSFNGYFLAIFFFFCSGATSLDGQSSFHIRKPGTLLLVFFTNLPKVQKWNLRTRYEKVFRVTRYLPRQKKIYCVVRKPRREEMRLARTLRNLANSPFLSDKRGGEVFFFLREFHCCTLENLRDPLFS